MSEYDIEGSPYHQNPIVGDALDIVLRVRLSRDTDIDSMLRVSKARQVLLFRMMLSKGIKKIEEWSEASHPHPFTDDLVEDAIKFAEQIKQKGETGE